MIDKRISFTPLLLIVPWTLACFIGAAIISSASTTSLLQGPALVISTVIALGPLLLYFALTRPLGLPFAAYALLAQFDHLFPPGPLGTIAAISGLFVIVTLLVRFLRDKQAVKAGPALYGWVFFLSWVIISLLWTYEPGIGMLEIRQMVALFILYALITITTADVTDMRIAILAVILAACAASIFGIVSYGGAHISPSATYRATLFNGTRNNFIDPNHLAASLQIPLALLLVMMFRERQPLLKLTYFCGCGILGAGMLVTGSRTGLISMGVMFLYFFLRSRYRFQLSMIGTGVLGLSATIPTVWTRFGDQTSGALGGRLPIWRVAFSAFKDHWFIGHGAGTAKTAYELALRKTFESPDFFYQSIEIHNIFLYAGVEFGVIGIALLAYAWWAQFRTLSMIPKGDPLYDLRLAIEAGILALLVEACTLDLLTFKYLWIAFSLAAIVRATWLRRMPTQRTSNQQISSVLT